MTFAHDALKKESPCSCQGTWEIYIGIDVSKGYADIVCLCDDEIKNGIDGTYNDTPTGWEIFTRKVKEVLEKRKEVRVVMGVESTGSYHVHWAECMIRLEDEYGDRVQGYVVQPYVIRKYREVELKGNKTDRKSAEWIALYLEKGHTQGVVKAREARRYEDLRSLVRLCMRLERAASREMMRLKSLLYETHPYLEHFMRGWGIPLWICWMVADYPSTEELVNVSAEEISRRYSVGIEKARDVVEGAKRFAPYLKKVGKLKRAVIKAQAKTVVSLSQELGRLKAELIERCKYEYAEEIELLTSIPGIGEYAAAVILSEAGQVKRFPTSKKFARYLGVTPYYHQSGNTWKCMGITKQGSPLVRKMLFVCALSAIRTRTPFQDFYVRLLGRGKPKKVALVAVMHKLARTIWAIIYYGQPYDPDFLRKKQIAVPEAHSPAQPEPSPSSSHHAQQLDLQYEKFAPYSPKVVKKLKRAHKICQNNSNAHPQNRS